MDFEVEVHVHYKERIYLYKNKNKFNKSNLETCLDKRNAINVRIANKIRKSKIKMTPIDEIITTKRPIALTKINF
jgi:translation initiation factor IF-1